MTETIKRIHTDLDTGKVTFQVEKDGALLTGEYQSPDVEQESRETIMAQVEAKMKSGAAKHETGENTWEAKRERKRIAVSEQKRVKEEEEKTDGRDEPTVRGD